MSTPTPVVFTSGAQGTFHQGADGKCSLDVTDAQGRIHTLACTQLPGAEAPKGIPCTVITCATGERSMQLLVPDKELRPVQVQLTGLPLRIREQLMQFLDEDDDRDVACEILSAVTIPEGQDPEAFLQPILEQASSFPEQRLELLSFFGALHQQCRLIPRSAAVDTLLREVLPHLTLFPVQRAQLFHLILSGHEPSMGALQQLRSALAKPAKDISRQSCVAQLVAATLTPQMTPGFLRQAVAFLQSSPFAVLDLATFLAKAQENSTLQVPLVFIEAARLAGVPHETLELQVALQNKPEPIPLPPALLERVDRLWTEPSERDQARRLLSTISVPYGEDPTLYLTSILERVLACPIQDPTQKLELLSFCADLHKQDRFKLQHPTIQLLLTEILPLLSGVARAQLFQFILSSSTETLETKAATDILGKLCRAAPLVSLEKRHEYLIRVIGLITCPTRPQLVNSALTFLKQGPPILDLVKFFRKIDTTLPPCDEEQAPYSEESLLDAFSTAAEDVCPEQNELAKEESGRYSKESELSDGSF